MITKSQETLLKKKLPQAVRLAISFSVAAGAISLSANTYAQDAQGVATDSAELSEEMLEEVLVTGQRASIVSAQEIKRNADEIVDSIVASDIGKLPDRSVTETLQRVPGVTVNQFQDLQDPEHFSAEGSGVSVRGLPHVRSGLNGRDTFTADGGRALSFQDVPPELMAGVDVYKNPAADQIEGGLGVVNLRTRMPFDTDGQLISGSVSVNYGDFAEEMDPAASLLYSNIWGIGAGEIGVLLHAAYSELSTRSDGLYTRAFQPYAIFDEEGEATEQRAYVPRGADWRRFDFNRERTGLYGAIQWRPNDRSEAYITAFRSDYDERWDENAMFVSTTNSGALEVTDAVFDTQGSNHIFESGSLTSPYGVTFGSDTRIATRNSITTDLAIGYQWQANGLEVNTSLQWVEGTSADKDLTVSTNVEPPEIFVDLTGDRPIIEADAEYLANPANHSWGFTMPHLTDNQGEQLAWSADAKYSFDASPISYVKSGIRLTDREADNTDTGYQWSAIYQDWMRWWGLPGGGDQFPPIEDTENIELFTFDNFFRGDARVPTTTMVPTEAMVTGYPESWEQLMETTEPCCSVPDAIPSLSKPEFQNQQSEETQAIYLMAGFEFDEMAMPLRGNAGVRYVRTENVATGHILFPNTVINTEQFRPFAREPEERDFDNSYSHVLPSLNATLEIRDDLYARFAAAKAIARPDFTRLNAVTVLAADFPEGVSQDNDPSPDVMLLSSDEDSNPMLEPIEANQFDVSLEWYFDEKGGMAHTTLFRKDLDGIIRNATSREQYPDAAGELREYLVTRPVNSGEATLQGFELGFTMFFERLPEPLDGFGLQANYTYIDSDTEVQPDQEPVDSDGSSFGALPYEGVSKSAYNIVGMYEKGPLSIRLAYNWRDEYLMSIGPTGYENYHDNGVDPAVDWRLPVFAQSRGQLDGSIFYDVSENLTVGFEANNITNAETRTMMRQNVAGDRTASYFVNDRRYAVTLRADF